MSRRLWGVAAVLSILVGAPVAFFSLVYALRSPAFIALISS